MKSYPRLRHTTGKLIPRSIALRVLKVLSPTHRMVANPSSDADTKSFNDIGIALGLDQSSDGHDYLSKYQENLGKLKAATCDIVIFSNNNPVATGSAFATYFPHATVHVIWLGKPELQGESALDNLSIHRFLHRDEIHEYLATQSNIQVIIDDGLNTKSSKLECFRDYFFHLKHGGVYVAEDLHASHAPERNDVDGDDVHRYLTDLISHRAFTKERLRSYSASDLALGRSVGHLTTYGDIVFVTKIGRHAFKLADKAANAILAQRLGTSWGEAIATRPGGIFSPESGARTNRADLSGFFKKNIKYPALTARAYDQVICSPGQIVYREEFILPDTYRLAFRGNFKHRRLSEANDKFVAVSDEMLSPTTYLDGDFFFLDREWHAYGHVPTEVISRLWAWDEAKLRYPELKVLVSAPDTADVLPSWEKDLIQAYGIPAEDIVVLTAPTRVKRLVAATPMFEISDYIHPEITPIWERVSEGLIDSEYRSPERVFLSRQPGAVRDCRNSDEVERHFENEGFLIIRPEVLPLGQQIALLRNAKVIAGYAGSALLNTVFAGTPKSVVVIGTDSFMNANEYLISTMIGGSFTYIFCTAEIRQPKGGWSQKAYHSPFSFSFEQDGAFLADTFREINSHM